MSIKPISLGLGSNPGRAAQAGSAQLINCYLEVSDQNKHVAAEQKSPQQIWASDGLEVWSSSLDGDGTRGMLAVDGVIYKVRGRRIYSVDAAGHETDIGGIASDAPVTMARNRRSSPQVGICSADGVYVVIDGNIVTDYSGSIRGGANSITNLAGYFIFTHDDGSVSHTQEDDGTTIDLLAYGLAESSADPAIRGLPKQGELVVFGTASIDYFSNIGADPFAFQRNQSISLGCAAAGSCAEVDQTILFVASDRTVRGLNGYQAQRVSNHAVERAIAGEADVSSISAVTWTRDGHTFYGISGTSFSWVYDLATGVWHQRESYNDSRWIASTIVESGGELVVGAYNSGSLYKMQRDTYAEGDNPLVVRIITPPVHAFPERVMVHALFVDMIPGVGTNDYVGPALTAGALAWDTDALIWDADALLWGDGTTLSEEQNAANGNPQLMLRYSLDGGQSWSSERQAAIGIQGDTLRQITFRRLGSTRRHGIVFELSASAAVMRGFLGAAVDAARIAA